MFVHSSALPHRLPPAAYHAPDWFQRELTHLFHDSWQLVGTTQELPNDGDFLSTNLWGHPIQVRNFDGELIALSNVCSHRHCLITSCASGHSQRMTCQYHGWEYDRDGRTGRIPQPKNFVPFDREARRLPIYRLACCGQLVFVSLASAGPTLAEWLGPIHDVCQTRFGVGWNLNLRWSADYPANWKVPVENSLEAYHVECVHPNTFREAPSEGESQHLLEERHTAFGTTLPFSAHSKMDEWFQRLEGMFLRWLGEAPTRTYWQHHVFPNLLFSFTDTISLCQCVLPVTEKSSRAMVRQFGIGTRHSPFKNGVARLWGKLASQITRGILAEDQTMFPAIQTGLESSQQAGVLGRCEERIHRFQEFMCQSLMKEPERD